MNALVGNLRPGIILPCRSSGRRMQLVCVEGPHLRLTVAKGDSEYRQWRSWGTQVLWPPDWVWLPGQQTEFQFANNAVMGAAEPRTLDGLVGGLNQEDGK